MAKDADFDLVGLLLYCDEADGSTTLIDRSPRPKIVTSVGTQTSNSQLLFGKNTLDIETGDYLTVPASTDFGFGTGVMTTQFWMRPALTGDANQVIIDFRSSDSAIPFALGITTGGTLRYYDGSAVRTGGSFAANVWTHVAWCRDAFGVNTLYVQGTPVSTYTATQDFGSSKGLCIGANVVKTAERFRGQLSNIHISKKCQWTEPFTPPAGPFARYGDLSGVVKDASGAFAARLLRAVREDTGQLVGQATSDGTTGAYTIAAGVDGPHTINAYPADGEDLPVLALRGLLPV